MENISDAVVRVMLDLKDEESPPAAPVDGSDTAEDDLDFNPAEVAQNAIRVVDLRRGNRPSARVFSARDIDTFRELCEQNRGYGRKLSFSVSKSYGYTAQGDVMTYQPSKHQITIERGYARASAYGGVRSSTWIDLTYVPTAKIATLEYIIDYLTAALKARGPEEKTREIANRLRHLPNFLHAAGHILAKSAVADRPEVVRRLELGPCLNELGLSSRVTSRLLTDLI
jgi:hypothetical protein